MIDVDYAAIFHGARDRVSSKIWSKGDASLLEGHTCLQLALDESVIDYVMIACPGNLVNVYKEAENRVVEAIREYLRLHNVIVERGRPKLTVWNDRSQRKLEDVLWVLAHAET